MLRPCPTTSSTWRWLQACRTWKEKGRFAITSPTLTTAWDSTATPSGQNDADKEHVRLSLIQTAAKPLLLPRSLSFRLFSRYYEQDLALAKDLQDKLSQAKAYCNLGLAHKALGEYNKAEECQRYLLSVAQALDNTQVRRHRRLLPANSEHGLFTGP